MVFLGLDRYRSRASKQKKRLSNAVKVPARPSDSPSKKDITFNVHNVTKCCDALPINPDSQNIIFERCGSVVPEAFSDLSYPSFESSDRSGFEPLSNAFIAAVHTAFSLHYPLVLSPDAVWLCIMQGFSAHINKNPEKLRDRFVKQFGAGKKEIMITVDAADYVKGSPNNPWEDVIDMFSEEIGVCVGRKTHNLLLPKFSTTGPAERMASQVVLMDCFKQYFCYQMIGVCGIPWITLQGTVADWRLLRKQALELRQYDLDWWLDELEPVLDHFVAAASGNADKDFWIRIYKLKKAYFQDRINGWILTLFPYVNKRRGVIRRNKFMHVWKTDTFKEKPTVSKRRRPTPLHNPGDGPTDITTSSFNLGVSSVPFHWECDATGKQHPMIAFAGFMAATQNPETLAIQPEIGWAIADKNEVDASEGVLELYEQRYIGMQH